MEIHRIVETHRITETHHTTETHNNGQILVETANAFETSPSIFPGTHSDGHKGPQKTIVSYFAVGGGVPGIEATESHPLHETLTLAALM